MVLGVVRMAQARSPWRLLRPVLLAGAATLTWLTLSASAATADSSADSGSLLGSVTSSVSSLTSPLTGTIAAPITSPAPAPAPAPVAPSPGLVQPAVSSLAGTADLFVTEAPVLNNVVPASTVSAVTAPVAAVADDATAGLVNTVVPPLAEAVPVLETLLEPVTDLVDGVGPLPELPVGVAVSSPVEALPAGSVTTSIAASGEPDAEPTIGLAGAPTMAPQPAAAGTTAPTALAAAGMRPAAPDAPLTLDPSAVPSPLGPTSGAGSGAPSSGSNGTAAWLDTFGFHLPLPGAFRISGPSEHAPSPVSFDPGSSPD
jgi:hypothetical protein